MKLRTLAMSQWRGFTLQQFLVQPAMEANCLILMLFGASANQGQYTCRAKFQTAPRQRSTPGLKMQKTRISSRCSGILQSQRCDHRNNLALVLP